MYGIAKGMREKANTDYAKGLHVRVGPDELVNMLDIADEALNGDSNDAEHDALFRIRTILSGIFENGNRE